MPSVVRTVASKCGVASVQNAEALFRMVFFRELLNQDITSTSIKADNYAALIHFLQPDKWRGTYHSFLYTLFLIPNKKKLYTTKLSLHPFQLQLGKSLPAYTQTAKYKLSSEVEMVSQEQNIV